MTSIDVILYWMEIVGTLYLPIPQVANHTTLRDLDLPTSIHWAHVQNTFTTALSPVIFKTSDVK